MARGRVHYLQHLSDERRSVPGPSSTPSPPYREPPSLSPTQSPPLPHSPPPPQPHTQANNAQPIPLNEMTVEQLLVQPGRDGLLKLVPHKPPKTYWFTDSEVGRDVTNTIKGFFKQPHANISQTSDDVLETWFRSFAQKWNWDPSITATVRSQFRAKVGSLLLGTVSRWKSTWRTKGIDAKPQWIELSVWEGLVRYWNEPHSVLTSAKCVTSRMGLSGQEATTPIEGQKAPATHTAGQKSFAAVGYDMAIGGELPPVLDVYEKTHKRKNGKFVNEVSEQLYNKVSEKILEHENLNISQKNDIFRQVAPKKKNRIVGMGSIQDIMAPSSIGSSSSDDAIQLRTQLETANTEIAAAHLKIAELEKNYEGLDQLWEMLAKDSPTIAEALQTRRSTQRTVPDNDQSDDVFVQASTAAMSADLPSMS